MRRWRTASLDKQLADVVLIDIWKAFRRARAWTCCEAGPIEGYDVKIKGTNDYKDTANSDIVVMTAGIPAQARHEPRRSAERELRGGEGRRRAGGEALAELPF